MYFQKTFTITRWLLPFILQSSDSVETPAPVAPAAVLLPSVTAAPAAPATVAPLASRALDELDLLGKTLLQQSLPPESQQVKW